MEIIFCVLDDVLTAEYPHEMQLPVSKDPLRGTLRGNASLLRLLASIPDRQV